MNNNELKELLCELDSDIDNELSEFLSTNNVLKDKFTRLIDIIVRNDGSLDNTIINRLDVLTDDMDAFNFATVKEDIGDLIDIL